MHPILNCIFKLINKCSFYLKFMITITSNIYFLRRYAFERLRKSSASTCILISVVTAYEMCIYFYTHWYIYCFILFLRSLLMLSFVFSCENVFALILKKSLVYFFCIKVLAWLSWVYHFHYFFYYKYRSLSIFCMLINMQIHKSTSANYNYIFLIFSVQSI